MLQAYDVLHQLVGPLDRASTLHRGGHCKGKLRALIAKQCSPNEKANLFRIIRKQTVIGFADEWRGKSQVSSKRYKATIRESVTDQARRMY